MVIPAFIMNIADAGNGYFVIKDCCSVSVVLSNFQLTEDEFCFLLWADFFGSYVFCFVWYLPCKSFHPKIKSVEGM